MAFFMISLTAILLIAFYSKRRITLIEAYGSFLFGALFQLVVDVQLSYGMNLYYYFENNSINPIDILINFSFGILGYLISNFYPSSYNAMAKIFYILVWSGYSILYEVYAVKTAFFNYNEWDLKKSMILYPLIVLILIGNLNFIRFLKNIEN